MKTFTCVLLVSAAYHPTIALLGTTTDTQLSLLQSYPRHDQIERRTSAASIVRSWSRRAWEVDSDTYSPQSSAWYSSRNHYESVSEVSQDVRRTRPSNENQFMSHLDFPRERSEAPMQLYDSSRHRQLRRREALTSRVQGSSRRTWDNSNHRNMQVSLQTEGLPLDANVELWDGPSNTPHKMRLWSEDGRVRPFHAVFETTGRGGGATDIRNTGPMEFPLSAAVAPTTRSFVGNYFEGSVVQGGSLKTFGVEPSVESVTVNLRSDGLPIMAVIELWEGPGRARQIAEVYNDRGRPFSAVARTPGYGSTIAVRNEGPMAYPLTVLVEPNAYG